MKNKIFAGVLVIAGILATYLYQHVMFAQFLEGEITPLNGVNGEIHSSLIASGIEGIANYLEVTNLFFGIMLWLILIGVITLLFTHKKG